MQLRKYAPSLWTLLSSIFIVLAFPPFDLYPLVWFCLVPWFFALENRYGMWPSFIEGVWLSLFMTLGGFYWMAIAGHEFGGMPWVISILVLLLFGLGNQPQFLIFAILWERWRWFFAQSKTSQNQNGGIVLIGIALVLSLLYTGIDWLIPKLYKDTLGHSLHEAKDLRQLAEYGGAYLLTTLVFISNFTIWRVLRTFWRRAASSFYDELIKTFPLCAFTLILCLGGWYEGSRLRGGIEKEIATPSRTLQLGVIQGNIGDFDKVAAERGIQGAAEKILQNFTTLSNQALSMTPKPEAVVWPETTFPSNFRNPESPAEKLAGEQVERWVNQSGTPLLFGGYDTDGRDEFNSFYFLIPRSLQAQLALGSDQQTYHKQILLPFAEYIPGLYQSHWVKKLFPLMGNFGRGPGPSVLKIYSPDHFKKEVLAGPIICYEALIPNYIIGAARKGSELILNITNDSWFGAYGEPYQHFALTKFRSLETRLPQLRSTNTGISALILQDGSVGKMSRMSEVEILNVTVPLLKRPPTLMILWGDWFGVTAMMLGCLTVFSFLYCQLRRNS